jgi:delta 1-pyrroline-5-carboxylate dehydrogenase
MTQVATEIRISTASKVILEDTKYDLTKFYIDGAWVAPRVKRELDVVNPATEEVIGKVALGGPEDVDAAVAAAQRAFETFSLTTREQRSRFLARSSPPTKRASTTSVRRSRTRWARR